MKKIISLFLVLAVLLTILHSLETSRSVVKTKHRLFQKNDTGTDKVWATVVSRINHGVDAYSLQYPSSLIPAAHAANIYDNASSYVAVDYSSGNVLSQKNANVSVPIASLTKIMSAVVVLDLLQPTDEITVSPQAPTVVPTKIGVDTGERMNVQDLLQAMLMYSANDAAQAINDGVNAKYGQDVFVRAMNEKAQFLGLHDTHFANPQGFDDPENFSSAADLAKLSHYALTNYPLIADIVNQDYTVEPATSAHKTYDLLNWNGLLGVYPGVSGVKIGNTGQAGFTTIVVSERDGKKVLAVVLGTPGIVQRDEWTAALLDDTFSEAYQLPPVNISREQLQTKYNSWYQH